MQCKASLHLGKRYSQRHNRRDYQQGEWNKDGHVKAERSALNLTLVDINLREFFSETFGEAIAEYNKKNKEKHPERCTTVSQYYHKYKTHVQEAIIQIGDADTYQQLVMKRGQEQADDFYKTALKNALKKWKEDNPSLKVFGAYLHMDEATPHLHLDFLPVVESKRGLSVKVSMDGAMKAIGYARTKSEKYEETSYKRWLRDCRADYEDFHQKQADELLGKDVLEILPSEPATRPHIETWQWRAEQLEQQKQQLQADVQKLSDKTQKLKAEAEQAERQKLMAIEIPPRPATPTPPEKPKEPWYADRATEKQYKKDCKQYDKDLKQYQIDLQQAQQTQRAWDTEYGLLDRVQTVDRQQADTQALQQQRAEQLRADAQALEQERQRLTQEREMLPQRATEIAQEQLSRSQKFAELMQVSQQWKDRYQQAFGKPYIGEEIDRDADKTTQTEHDGRPWEYGD